MFTLKVLKATIHIFKLNNLAYLSMFYNVVEQFSTRYIFHYHENVGRGANDLIPVIRKVIKTVNHQDI